MNKKAQQEMVGFILIVVLVMIGLMVFLILSARDSGESLESVEVDNMLSVIMKQTTSCAIPAEPYYKNYEDLFKRCYRNDECDNLGVSACEYLNESLIEVTEALFDSEATVDAYEFTLFVRDGEGQQGILRIFEGNCTGGTTMAAQRSIVAGSDSLVVRLNICKKN